MSAISICLTATVLSVIILGVVVYQLHGLVRTYFELLQEARRDITDMKKMHVYIPMRFADMEKSIQEMEEKYGQNMWN